MSDFPKALYRDGTEFDFEGRTLDMLTVADKDEMTAALAEGWAALPDVMKAKAKAKPKDSE